jgi:hypothetical protein
MSQIEDKVESKIDTLIASVDRMTFALERLIIVMSAQQSGLNGLTIAPNPGFPSAFATPFEPFKIGG